MSDTKTFGPNDELAWMVSCPPTDECDYRVYFTRADAEVADENFRDECMTDEDDADRRTQGVVGLVSIDKANDAITRLQSALTASEQRERAWREEAEAWRSADVYSNNTHSPNGIRAFARLEAARQNTDRVVAESKGGQQ